MSLLAIYFCGVGATFAFGIFGVIFGVNNGIVDLDTYTEEGRQRLNMALFLDTLAHAAIWPLSLPFQIATFVAARRRGEPIDLRFREMRHIEQPTPEECKVQCQEAAKSISEYLDAQNHATLERVTPVPLAAALVYLAWFQIWTEARRQGLSNPDARWNFLRLAERVSQKNPQ